MKLRIISDDVTSNRTQVLTESGEDIARYIRSMTINIEAGKVTTADVLLVGITAQMVLAELGVVQTEKKEGADA